MAALVAHFGSGILTPDGHVDRAKLGALVFADASARRVLEGIIHPAVRRRAAEREAEAPDGSAVVHVIPLLVETGQTGWFDAVVVVDVPETVQVARLMARNGLDESAARARLAAQVPRATRLAAAHVVIYNTGTREYLERAVDRAWARLVGTRGVR